MKYTHLTEEFLMVAGACVQGVIFARNNGLIGFPFDKLCKVKGEYEGFVHWLRFEVENLRYIRNGTSLVIKGSEMDVHWNMADPLRLVRKVEGSTEYKIYHLSDTKQILKTELYDGTDLSRTETLEYSTSGQLVYVLTEDTVYYGRLTRGLTINYDQEGRLFLYVRNRINGKKSTSVYKVEYSYAKGWFGTTKITETSGSYRNHTVLNSKYYPNGQLKRMGTLKIPQL